MIGISSVFPGFITSTLKFTSRYVVLVYRQSKLQKIRRKVWRLKGAHISILSIKEEDLQDQPVLLEVRTHV